MTSVRYFADMTDQAKEIESLRQQLAEANARGAELEGRVIEWAEVAGDLKAKLVAYEKDLPAVTKARIALLELAYEDVQSQLDTEREIKSDYGKRIDDLVGQIAALKAQHRTSLQPQSTKP